MRNFFLSLRAGRAHWKRITWNLNSIINQTTTAGCFAVDPVPRAQNALHSTAIRSHRFGQTMIYVSQPRLPLPLSCSWRIANALLDSHVYENGKSLDGLWLRETCPPSPPSCCLNGKWKKVAAVICSACFPHTHTRTHAYANATRWRPINIRRGSGFSWAQVGGCGKWGYPLVLSLETVGEWRIALPYTPFVYLLTPCSLPILITYAIVLFLDSIYDLCAMARLPRVHCS